MSDETPDSGFFALPENGHIPPRKRWWLLGISGALAALNGVAIVVNQRWLSIFAASLLSVWLIFVGVWLLLTGIRWAVSHTSERDFWPTVAGVLVGFAGLIAGFGILYYGLGVQESCGLGCTRRVKSVWDCMYFSVATLTTLGYGDITPYGVSRIVAGVEAIVGYGVLGVVVTILSSAFAPTKTPATPPAS